MISSLVQPDTEQPESAGFWAAARERRLVVQHCPACRHRQFPPRPLCSRCGNEATSWAEVSGGGQIWSFVVAHSPTLPAYEPFVPFPVAVIELQDAPGLRMVGNLVASEQAAINSVDPSSLSIGQTVRVVFQSVAPDVLLPRWMPMGCSGSRS